MSITSQAILEAPGVLANPYKFGTDIQYSQPVSDNMFARQHILFNKGRYFETSIYNRNTLIEVASLTGILVSYNNMIVGKWDQMEDFVIAMNILGYYVKIEIDWI